MNIRIASKEDIDNIVEKIFEALKEFPDFTIKGLIVTKRYYQTLCNLCFDNGVIIIAEDNGEIIGGILGFKNANIFSAMTELVTIATWVQPKRRKSSAFYRMFKKYEEYYKKEREQNKIDRVIMAKLTNHKTNIKFDKLGFKSVELTYEWR
jgi:hypothetical protein